MRALNIVHVFRAPLGGLFRHVVDLLRGQIARGHHVGIVADSLTGAARATEILGGLAPALALGITLTPMPRPLSPLDLPAVLHVTKRIRQTRADVVHGHGAKGGAYARLAVAQKRIVRAYTPHGGSLLLNHAMLSGKSYLALEKMLMARGDLFLFESAYSAEVFRAKVGNPQGVMRIVHNGISKAEFEPVVLSGDASDIVFVGEFRLVKGIDNLIDAIAVLRRGGRAVSATLVGDGPEAPALKAQVSSLGLEAAVRFAPAMPMRQALALGHLVVLPSRAESLPYVVLEAAAAAKPLITTRVGGVPEIYGPLADALVPAGDVQALAEAIATAFANPAGTEARAQMLRMQIADSFSVDAMVDSVLAGYQQALDSAPLVTRPVIRQA
jgi:glycosyltransferase involved in cell wall biosynthesis